MPGGNCGLGRIKQPRSRPRGRQASCRTSLCANFLYDSVRPQRMNLPRGPGTGPHAASNPPGVRDDRSLRPFHPHPCRPLRTNRCCKAPPRRHEPPTIAGRRPALRDRGSARAKSQENRATTAPRRIAPLRPRGRSDRRLNCPQFDRGAGRSFPGPASHHGPSRPQRMNPRVVTAPATSQDAGRTAGRIAPIQPSWQPPAACRRPRSRHAASLPTGP